MATNLPTSKLCFLTLALGAAVAGAAGLACGPSGSGLLLGDDGLGGGPTGVGTDGGDWGNGGGGPTYNAEGGVTPVQVKLFQSLEKDFVAKCGSCHQNGTGGVVTQVFLKGPDVYTTIKNYPGIVSDDIYGSKLLNRPANHPVASLQDPGNEALLGQVTAWLSAEAVAIKATPLPTTDIVDPMSGSVDLTKAGIAGAKIVFTPSVTGTTLRLNDVRLQAPTTSGIHVASPTFVIIPTTGPEVSNTTFSTSDLSVPAAGTATIGTVLYAFNFPSGAKIRIQFQKIEAATVAATDAGSSASSCKAQADFTNTARPVLQANCANCHGGNNANATAAFDMTKLASDPAAACTQARFKINLADKNNSNILLAPLANSGLGHPVKPFGNTGAAGYQSILTWVNKE
ncbi:hypothetical protein BH09MYX1_BH09MYX1_33160 [soil metagenome]